MRRDLRLAKLKLAKVSRLPDSGTVWAATIPRRNQRLANAESFGKVQYVYPEETWAAYDKFLTDIDREYNRIHMRLKDFDPERDYYLPIGDPVQALMCAVYVSHLCGGTFAMLIWNPHIFQYECVEVDVAQYFECIEDDGDDDDEDNGEELRGGGTTGEAG